MPFEQLVAKRIDFSSNMTWGGGEAMKSNYKEHNILRKKNFSENELEVEVNQEKVSLCSLCGNKRVYREFIRRKPKTRVTISKLKYELNTSDHDHEMEKVFLLPFKVSTDVKSRDFQYRYINQCICPNSFLK